MKLAAGLIGIFLSLLVMLQACAIFAGGSVTQNETIGGAGAVGLVVGFLYFLGGAFSFGLPIVAVVIYALAGLLALAIAGDFPDMQIWAWVSFALAAMAFFAWRSARRKAARAAQVNPAATGTGGGA